MQRIIGHNQCWNSENERFPITNFSGGGKRPVCPHVSSGPALGAWASNGPVSVQASKAPDGGPFSSGLTVGDGVGYQYFAVNTLTQPQ